jgi:hypothetical protein
VYFTCVFHFYHEYSDIHSRQVVNGNNVEFLSLHLCVSFFPFLVCDGGYGGANRRWNIQIGVTLPLGSRDWDGGERHRD